MSNTLILNSIVEGAPVITTSTVVLTFSTASYYTLGQIVDSALFGSSDAINRLVSLGAIQLIDPLFVATSSLTATTPVRGSATLRSATSTATT